MNRQLVHRLIDMVLADFGRHRWPVRTSTLVVLTYHRILPLNHPALATAQPGMYVTPETLCMHLRLLKRYFELLDLSEWISFCRHDRFRLRRACALTFDDGWEDNYRYAFPILRDQNVPSTVFVATAKLGNSDAFWPERLVHICQKIRRSPVLPHTMSPALDWLAAVYPGNLRATPLDPILIDQVICAAKPFADSDIEKHLKSLEAILGEPPPHSEANRLLTWEQLSEMVSSGLIAVGSHTRNHIRLSAKLDAARLVEEVRGSYLDIHDCLSIDPELFCYPNGDISDTADQIVRTLYRGACITSQGWNSRTADPFRLRRIHIHEDIASSPTQFLSRISGILW